MKNLWLICILFLLNNGCVEPFDLPMLENSRVMVVDGMITDQPGTYTVKLFLSNPPEMKVGEASPVTGATVQISNSLGERIKLNENETGIYTTDKLITVVGQTYKLNISVNGKEYESIPAELKAAGVIENVYFEFKPNSINPNDQGKPQHSFAVYVDAKGAGNETALMRWRWSSVHHIKTFPELRQKKIVPPGSHEGKWVPDPLPCSGYVTSDIYDLTRVGPCECCDCYVTQYSNSIVLSNNKFVSQNQFNKVQIATLPTDKWLFYDRIYIEVEQLRLDENAYNFWDLVNDQQKGANDIFQPNVVKIKGNIKCLTNPEEEVFGVFAVSGSTKNSVFIHRHDIPVPVAAIDALTSDCRKTFENSTTEKPPFW